MILEVLLALLIFSLGVLGLVGLQAQAARQSGQSQYRATATVLANELVGTMWVNGDRTSATLQSTYGSDSTDPTFLAWKARVVANLPGAADYPPIITFTPQAAQTMIIPAGYIGNLPPTPISSTQVSITMQWRLPSETKPDQLDKTGLHNIVMFTQIK